MLWRPGRGNLPGSFFAVEISDRYEVLGRLGQGGMATVWKATDRTTKTTVAIKVLLPHLLSNEMVVERFKREIAAVRRIEHPGVIQIFDLIERDDLLALVLEYHDGLDLKRTLRRRGAMDPDSVIDLGAQLLDALGAAHDKGVIHRDVKPHNVLLDAEGRAKLTDFGLARVDDLVRVTSHTMPFGSPEYVAPELLGSDVVDPRADLYSLGVTLFEAATGKVPFRADSPLALVRMHEKAALPDMAPHGLPEPLEAAILGALAKDPDQRFPTAAAMKAALLGSATTALAPVHTPRTCGKCGAALVVGVGHCIECDFKPVSVEGQTRGGRRVIVDPRRNVGQSRDCLTFEEKAKLMRTLRELGAADKWIPREVDARLKEMPACIADRLSDEDAKNLSGALRTAGFRNVVTTRGFLGFIETAWRTRTSVVLHMLFYLMVVGPMFIIPIVALFGGVGTQLVEAAVGLAYVLGFLASGSLWLLTSMGRTAPIVGFTGVAGIAQSDDPLALRAAKVFEGTGPRLRNLLRRVLNRGFQIEARPMIEAALDAAEEIVDLEAKAAALDPQEIADRIQTLEEKIEDSDDTYETEALIEEKHERLAALKDLDALREETGLRYAELLTISSRMLIGDGQE